MHIIDIYDTHMSKKHFTNAFAAGIIEIGKSAAGRKLRRYADCAARRGLAVLRFAEERTGGESMCAKRAGLLLR